MVIYNLENKRRTCHFSFCSSINYIAENNKKFITLAEAKRRRYPLCYRCNRIANEFFWDKERIDEYCKENGLQYKFDYEKLKVVSRLDEWLVLFNSKVERFVIYHKSNQHYDDKDGILGYHFQLTSENVLTSLQIIKDHDDWALKQEMSTAKNNQNYRKKFIGKRKERKESKYSLRHYYDNDDMDFDAASY